MGVSFDLKHRHLPTNRHHYPNAPFASLWTQRPEDADRAYDLYRVQMNRSWDYKNPFLEIWGGRPFNVPSIVSTYQYAKHWGDASGTTDQCAILVAQMSELTSAEMRLLLNVVQRKRAVAVAKAGYGIADAQSVASQLTRAGWCESTETKATKSKPIPEPALAFVRDDREILLWELERRNWICELMVRYQYAYEATQSSMIDYRASGVSFFVEVLTRDCCKVCARKYPRRIPVTEIIEIPVDGCENEHGCICCVLPVVDMDD